MQDIWTIFHFLMPGLLGNHKEFHKFILKDDQQKQLKAQIAPFILRRTRDMVLQELPEKEEIVVFCPMTVEQQKQYFQMLRRRTEIKTGQWMQLLTLILRLRQLCCDPWLISHSNESTIQKSGKLIWLLEKLKEISQEKSSKIIIFSQFTSLLERLQAIVNTLYPKTYLLTGKTLSLQRRQLIKSFQEQQQAAFLISLKAGGTGITLNTADTIFILDPWWNPAVEQQAIARAHRLGQAHSLVVYRLLIEDSIESNIQQMQATKTQLFSRLFDGKSTNNTQNYWDQLYKLLETKENSLRNPITHT